MTAVRSIPPEPDRSPSGLYHGRGWRVDVGADASRLAVTIASIHEAMHERLQVTTIYGCVVILLQSLGTVQPDGPWSARAAALQRGATDVHEQFATWLSAVPAEWNREEIAAEFPRYLRHFDRASNRVAGLANPYLQMHLIQAVARACMQPAELADQASADLALLTPAIVDRRSRPDHRLRVLDQLLTLRGPGPISRYRGPAVDLSLSNFADDNDAEWAALNSQAYAWCAQLLNEAGYPTLPYDGHLPAVHAATAAAIDIAGGPIGVSAGDGGSGSAKDVALSAVESETMTLGEPIVAYVHPPGTDPAEMLAGGAERQHLFLAIRPRRRLLDQYQLSGHPLTEAEHVAVLRCGTSAGVEILEVTDHDPAQLASAHPVVVSVSMRSLAEPTVRERWQPVLNRQRATVLVDLRPSVHLVEWLADPRLTLRWDIFGTGTFYGTVRILAFKLTRDDGVESRTYLCPVSALYCAGFQLWLQESPLLAGRARRDDELGNSAPVRFTIAHIATEERTFDFHAGEIDD